MIYSSYNSLSSISEYGYFCPHLQLTLHLQRRCHNNTNYCNFKQHKLLLITFSDFNRIKAFTDFLFRNSYTIFGDFNKDYLPTHMIIVINFLYEINRTNVFGLKNRRITYASFLKENFLYKFRYQVFISVFFWDLKTRNL